MSAADWTSDASGSFELEDTCKLVSMEEPVPSSEDAGGVKAEVVATNPAT